MGLPGIFTTKQVQKLIGPEQNIVCQKLFESYRKTLIASSITNGQFGGSCKYIQHWITKIHGWQNIHQLQVPQQTLSHTPNCHNNRQEKLPAALVCCLRYFEENSDHKHPTTLHYKPKLKVNLFCNKGNLYFKFDLVVKMGQLI